MKQVSQDRNLTHSIVHDLGIAIIQGKYSPDGMFPEGELCEAYGVSRTVLREAVKMLTAKGLIGSRPRQGTRVLPESEWNLLDPDVLRWLLERKFSIGLLLEFTEVRLAIEPRAASRAARVASAEEKAAIMAAIERMMAAERNEDNPLTSDIAFHVAVLKASGNRFYERLTDLTETALRFSIQRTNEYKGVRTGNVLDHKRVADAILAGDSEEARSQMFQLLQGALDLMRDVEDKTARKKA